MVIPVESDFNIFASIFFYLKFGTKISVFFVIHSHQIKLGISVRMIAAFYFLHPTLWNRQVA
jgi:hypothetical protein